MNSRILLIEDEPGLVLTVSDLLLSEGYEVQSATDGESGLEQALSGAFDLIILDVMLPRKNGFDVCSELRQRGRDTAVLMLTARTQVPDRVVGLKLGADDYLTKPFDPAELLARVQALLRRAAAGPATPPAPTRVGDLEIDLWAKQVRVAGRAVNLTATEFRLLAALARHPGRIFTREELVARMFGPDYDGLDRTVDVHVTNLRKKIEPGREPRYVLTAHGVGYRLGS